jgi:hypothetical protein
LKSREKLYEHDLIWKGICADLRWEYLPSIWVSEYLSIWVSE